MIILPYLLIGFATFFRTALCVKTYSEMSAEKRRFDKNVNIFSDSGELTQVEYAINAGLKGGSILCAKSHSKEVVICIPTAREPQLLLDRRSVDKVAKVDENIWAAFAGLAGDGRSLMKFARKRCLENYSKYGTFSTAQSVAHAIGEVQHESTISGSKSAPTCCSRTVIHSFIYTTCYSEQAVWSADACVRLERGDGGL